LDKKGILLITYSIRYGTPSARIVEELTLEQLDQLEAYGQILDVTQTPKPTETTSNKTSSNEEDPVLIEIQ
jgi:hypothetical protein